MQKLLTKTFGYMLDMIFPIECLGCGKNLEELPPRERWICPACMYGIRLRDEQVCPYCEKESEGGKTHGACRGKISLDGLWAASYYDDFIEKAVHEFKFNLIRDISFPLGEIMANSVLGTSEYGDIQDMILVNYAKDAEEGVYVDEEKNMKPESVVVPVPLHRKRYNWRGFNQSHLMAKHVGDRFGLPVREDMLVRVKNTKPQSKTRNEEERRKNIDCAFSCPDPEKVRSKNIILVDDVCTTSATLNECAKEMKKAGARNVWALVVARR